MQDMSASVMAHQNRELNSQDGEAKEQGQANDETICRLAKELMIQSSE